MSFMNPLWWSTEIRVLEFESGIQWGYWMSGLYLCYSWVQVAKQNENESWLNETHNGVINSKQMHSWQATPYSAVVRTNVGFGIIVKTCCLLSRTAYTANCMAVDSTPRKRISNVRTFVSPSLIRNFYDWNLSWFVKYWVLQCVVTGATVFRRHSVT